MSGNFMVILDYIWWRMYTFFLSHRIFSGMEEIDATSLLYLMICMPFTPLIGYLCSCGIFPTTEHNRYLYIMILFPTYIPFLYRYIISRKIKANNYQTFKSKWEKESIVLHKKRGRLIVLLCITNIILFPLGTILLQIFHIIQHCQSTSTYSAPLQLP